MYLYILLLADRACLYNVTCTVRVIRCNAEGSVSDMIAGLDWVAKHQAPPAAVSMSIVATRPSQPLDAALQRLIRLGVPAVVAAGNYDSGAHRVNHTATRCIVCEYTSATCFYRHTHLHTYTHIHTYAHVCLVTHTHYHIHILIAHTPLRTPVY